MSINRKQKADLFMLLITIIWSGTFIIIKNALFDVPPFLYTSLRFFAATCIGLVLWHKQCRNITLQQWKQGSILAFFFALGFMSQTWGLQYTSVAHSSFITGSMVVFTPIAAYFIERKNITRIQVLGVGIVLIGLWFFTQADSIGTSFNAGDIATLFCAAIWGLYITFTDKFMRDAKDIQTASARLTLVQFGVTGIISLIASLLFEVKPYQIPDAIFSAFQSNSFIIAFLYTAILASVVATYIQTRYQHETSPVKAALMFSTEPVLATLLAVAFSAEYVSTEKYVIGAIVLVGVLSAQIEDFFPRLFKK